MGRGEDPQSTATVAPSRRLATSEARDQFTKLVNELKKVEEAADSLADHAVEIGPHRTGGVWLVPEVDAKAAMRRLDVLEARCVELEDQLEEAVVAQIVADRAGTPWEEGQTVEDFAASMGVSDALPKSR